MTIDLRPERSELTENRLWDGWDVTIAMANISAPLWKRNTDRLVSSLPDAHRSAASHKKDEGERRVRKGKGRQERRAFASRWLKAGGKRAEEWERSRREGEWEGRETEDGRLLSRASVGREAGRKGEVFVVRLDANGSSVTSIRAARKGVREV
jgi:hypothetical protein